MSEKQEEKKAAEPKKAEAQDRGGVTFFVVVKSAKGEQVQAVKEDDLKKFVDVETELFSSEKEATERRDALQRQRVFRNHQRARAAAKVARERQAFAERHPEVARLQERKANEARERQAEHLAKRETEAPKA